MSRTGGKWLKATRHTVATSGGQIKRTLLWVVIPMTECLKATV